ncbi:Multiple epidermal growth factor-like domains protein 8 [Dissophora globulifera]|nr:Multiple epidermal growth factor-like domains protein 8 [Dissophora globulifera]
MATALHARRSRPPLGTIPLSVSGASFARTSTKLYISGGNHSQITLNQFVVLDLTLPWNASAPAWKILAPGPTQYLFPSVVAADEKTMITFHSGASFIARYSVAENIWTNSTVQAAYPTFQGVGAVLVPATNNVYMAGGYTSGRDYLTVYNANTDIIRTDSPLPLSTSALFLARSYYGNVWSEMRRSILYFGGYDAQLKPLLTANVVTEFVPYSGAWSTMTTMGTPPPMRADHCMATNEDGSKVVIYGGRLSSSSTFLSDMYILDVATRTWSQGTSGPTRVYTVCTMVGNQLLIWGGSDAPQRDVSADVLIYNIDLKAWVTNFTPQLSNIKSPGSPNSNPDSRPTSPNAGAIAGGVVGGLAVIMAAILLFIFLRKGRRPAGSKLIATGEMDEDPDQRQMSVPSITTPTGNDEELRTLRTHNQVQEGPIPPAYSYPPPINYNSGSPAVYTAGPPIIYSADPYRPINNIYVQEPYMPPLVGLSSMSHYHAPSTSTQQVYLGQPYQSASSPTPPYTVAAIVTTGTSRSPTPSNFNSTRSASSLLGAVGSSVGDMSEYQDHKTPRGNA